METELRERIVELEVLYRQSLEKRAELEEALRMLGEEVDRNQQKLDKAAKRESGMVAREIEREGELAAAKQELTALRKALWDAIDGYEECAQYKGDYLSQKHGDAEEIARLRELLNKGGDGEV